MPGQVNAEKQNVQAEWRGRAVRAGLLLLQLLIFARCSTIAWTTHDASWIAWIAASVSLPMLMMRRILPPGIAASNGRMLTLVSAVLTLAGWLVFTRFTDILGTTVFVTLGAFSLGFAIWLSMLGLQHAGNPTARRAIAPATDGRLLNAVFRRRDVFLPLLMPALTAAGVFSLVSLWPLASESAVERSRGSDAVLAMLLFWLGGTAGGVPWLQELEPGKMRRLVLPAVFIILAFAGALMPDWPLVLFWLPPLLAGYGWIRSLREAAEMLRVSVPRSLRRRIPRWLLGWSGTGALLAGLLSFSLFHGIQAGEPGAWLRGPFFTVVLLLGAALVAWSLRGDARAADGISCMVATKKEGGVVTDGRSGGDVEDGGGSAAGPGPGPWFDFPALQLGGGPPMPADPVMVEIAYDIPEEKRSEFLRLMGRMEAVRLEEGAVWWNLTTDSSHPTVFHEFFRIESWSEYRQALREQSDAARQLKVDVFACNDWETMPAEIHYPVLGVGAPWLSAGGQGKEHEAQSKAPELTSPPEVGPFDREAPTAEEGVEPTGGEGQESKPET